MRVGITILALVMMTGGCATATKRGEVSAQRHDVDSRYAESSAGTLAFDPPVTQYGPRLNLSRDVRQPAAFVGYDQTVTTFYYLRSDDRQSSDHQNDRYERRAISESFGTSYR